MITNMISYNLQKRERTHLGQDRDYQDNKNIPALVGAINGGRVQELVNKGDMIGYYTHWPRIKFGMRTECGVVDGKIVCAEPAIRTTYLKASVSGLIEHKIEFLGTEAGKMCERLHKSKMGGFSSVIDERAPDFIAFDYVPVPNFDSNRGYKYEPTFDSSFSSSATMGGAVDCDHKSLEKAFLLSEYKNQVHAMNVMLMESQGDIRRIKELEASLDDALSTVNAVQLESEELYSIIATKGYAIDSVGSDYVRPIIAKKDPIDKFREGLTAFDSAVLPEFESLSSEGEEPQIIQPVMIQEMIKRLV